MSLHHSSLLCLHILLQVLDTQRIVLPAVEADWNCWQHPKEQEAEEEQFPHSSVGWRGYRTFGSSCTTCGKGCSVEWRCWSACVRGCGAEGRLCIICGRSREFSSNAFNWAKLCIAILSSNTPQYKGGGGTTRLGEHIWWCRARKNWYALQFRWFCSSRKRQLSGDDSGRGDESSRASCGSVNNSRRA
jgi:hypothetical protein